MVHPERLTADYNPTPAIHLWATRVQFWMETLKEGDGSQKCI